MAQVTGFVVVHAGGQYARRLAHRYLRQELHYVAHLRAEAGGALGPLRVVVQQFGVLLGLRSARRAVADDIVHIVLLEQGYILAGEALDRLKIALLGVGRATALLRVGRDYLV